MTLDNWKKRAPSTSPARPRKKERLSSPLPLNNDDSEDVDEEKIPMNPLPTPATLIRPSRSLFVFGNGDMGQFGLGPDHLGDIPRPKLHVWFQDASSRGILGGPGGGLARVSAGGMHTLAVDEEGKVWSWGINDNASLGRRTSQVADPQTPGLYLESDTLESTPAVVESLVQEGFRAVDVAAGDSVSVALSDHGELRVWGSFRASDGLLGFNSKPRSSQMQFTPTSLPLLSRLSFSQISCGTDHVLALSTLGTVHVWGNGQQGQLGKKIIERRKINALSPERLALRRIKIIGTGAYHSFAIDELGVVYAWGLNNMRQTGIGDALGGREDIIWKPTQVSALHPSNLGFGRRVVQISGGEHHTLFRLNDGSVYGCGRCDCSQLGLANDHPALVASRQAGSGSIIPEPIQIPFPPQPTPEEPNPPVSAVQLSNPIVHVSAGTRHNLAVSHTGQVYSWGLGNSCELGLGRNVEVQVTPTRILALDLEGCVVRGASAGGQHCVLLATRFQ